MPSLHELPSRDAGGALRVVVESPRGSPLKLKYEPKLGAFVVTRPLVLGAVYPYDWGFVPSTLAPDGDPLDAMVLAPAGTFPGVVHACRALGVVKITQRAKDGTGRQSNDRVIAVPTRSSRFADAKSARDLPQRVRQELEAFFVTAVLFEDKDVKLEGWSGAKRADALVREAARAFARARARR